MNRKVTQLIAWMALLGPTPAVAVTIDLDPLSDTPQTFSRSLFRTGNDSGTPLGAFTDVYTFSLSENGTVLGDFTVIQGGRTRLSTGLELAGGDLIDSLTDSTLGSFAFPNLPAGTYSLSVRGSFSGVSGVSSYTGHIFTGISDLPQPAVPEPETWAMFVVGFAIVGATLRRQKAGAAAGKLHFSWS